LFHHRRDRSDDDGRPRDGTVASLDQRFASGDLLGREGNVHVVILEFDTAMTSPDVGPVEPRLRRHFHLVSPASGRRVVGDNVIGLFYGRRVEDLVDERMVD
jgi:hypothetical protein